MRLRSATIHLKTTQNNYEKNREVLNSHGCLYARCNQVVYYGTAAVSSENFGRVHNLPFSPSVPFPPS